MSINSILFVLADAEPSGNAQVGGEFHHSPVRISAPCSSLIESFIVLAVAYFGNTYFVKAASKLSPFIPLQLASCLFWSTYDRRLACSPTSMMADYRLLWVCS